MSSIRNTQACLRDGALDFLSRIPRFRGRDRFGACLARMLNRWASPIALARLDSGSRVYVDLRCPDHWNAFVLHVYDSALVNSLKDVLVKPGCVFMDIGASVGLISMSLASHVEDLGGRILAYEPHAANRDLLCKSVAVNGLSEWVAFFPFALGDRSGYVALATSETMADVGNAMIVGDVSSAPQGNTDSKMITLDEHVETLGLERLDCIKLDVEGFEFDVLHGASHTLQRFKPVIFGEFNTVFLSRRGVDLDEAWVSLESMPYELQQFRSEDWETVHSRPEQRCWNLRMVPADSR